MPFEARALCYAWLIMLGFDLDLKSIRLRLMSSSLGALVSGSRLPGMWLIYDLGSMFMVPGLSFRTRPLGCSQLCFRSRF